MKLKHFSNKELLDRKDEIRIRAYDHYSLYAGYKVINSDKDIIGYITFNQFMKADTITVKNGYSYREYAIL